MASSILQTVASPQLRDCEEVFGSAFFQLKAQLIEGHQEPVVSFSEVSLLGLQGLEDLETKLGEVFGVSMAIDVDLIANTVKALPVLSMTPEQTPESSAGAHHAKKLTKVPRPPNAFILYRKEWHSRVVAANPDLHNNGISILLGEKWRCESQAVRDDYKRKAALAKEEHAVLHPNYSYQPRKPSEKKRRMTKSKLARLAAMAASHLPTIDFEAVPGHAVFDADVDFGGTLMPSLHQVKAVYSGPAPHFPASCLINTSDGIITDDVANMPIGALTPVPLKHVMLWSDMSSMLADQQHSLVYSQDSALPGPGYRGGNLKMITPIDPYAEVRRQAKLQEEMNLLFDFASAATTAGEF